MKVNAETWEEFIDHAIAVQQLAESTIEETIRKLKYLEKHGINLMANKEDLKRQVYNFFSRRLKSGASRSAINHYVRALNRWCKFRGLDLKFKKYREAFKPRRIPTTEDLKQFMSVIDNKRDRTIVYLFINSGIRESELINMNLDDIDWKNCMIIVRGKGGKVRYIPLPRRVLYGRNVPSLYLYITKHRLNTDKKALFTTKQGRISPTYLRNLIKKRARQAGLPWIHTHSLRHYAATNWLRAGLNIRVVQELLGHENIETTGIYLHIVESDLMKALENPKIEDPLRVSRPRKNREVLTKSLLMLVAGSGELALSYKIFFCQNIGNFPLFCFSGGDAFV